MMTGGPMTQETTRLVSIWYVYGDAQELSAEETDVQSAIATVRNINLRIQARQETVAQQLKRTQVDFMIAADLWRETERR